MPCDPETPGWRSPDVVREFRALPAHPQRLQHAQRPRQVPAPEEVHVHEQEVELVDGPAHGLVPGGEGPRVQRAEEERVEDGPAERTLPPAPVASGFRARVVQLDDERGEPAP